MDRYLKNPKLFVSLHNIIRVFVAGPPRALRSLTIILRKLRPRPEKNLFLQNQNRLSCPIPRRSVCYLRRCRRAPECHLEGKELWIPVYHTANGKCVIRLLEV